MKANGCDLPWRGIFLARGQLYVISNINNDINWLCSSIQGYDHGGQLGPGWLCPSEAGKGLPPGVGKAS